MKISKIFLALAIFGFLSLAASALAATGDYVPLVQIPGIPAGANFLQYLSGIYNFLISIVGILAMASLVYGGFRYLTSVGNPAAVEDAKDIINSAIVGLVLALSSWLILNEINPDVLVLRKPGQIGALPGKHAYNQPPSTRDCVVDTSPEGVPIQGDPTKKKCSCADGQSVTFTPSALPPGPYVVSTSITPCSTNVPVNTSPLIITFSEKMDPATIIGANFILISGSLPFTVALDPATQDKAILTLTTPLMSPALDELKISSNIKSAKGVNLVSDYDLKFTTGSSSFSSWSSSCTPPAQIVPDCMGACSNPLTPGLTPSGYHCIKADLRVGDNLNNMVSDKISINAGQKLYFDMSNSKDPSGNPIARYEINWDGAPLGGIIGSFDCCPQGTGILGTGIIGCPSWPALCPFSSYCPQNLVVSPPSTTYTTAKTYTVWYRVYNNNCDSATNPTAITIDVK